MTGMSLALGLSLSLALPFACLMAGLKAVGPSVGPETHGWPSAGADNHQRVQKRLVELLRKRRALKDTPSLRSGASRPTS